MVKWENIPELQEEIGKWGFYNVPIVFASSLRPPEHFCFAPGTTRLIRKRRERSLLSERAVDTLSRNGPEAVTAVGLRALVAIRLRRLSDCSAIAPPGIPKDLPHTFFAHILQYYSIAGTFRIP